MNRRSFLRLFGAAAPIIAAKPTYFFAPIGGWKSKSIVNPFEPGEAMFFLDPLQWTVGLPSKPFYGGSYMRIPIVYAVRGFNNG